MKRKEKISYSIVWARTHSNVFKPVSSLAKELGVEIIPHDKFFDSIDKIKMVITASNNGFEDIVNKKLLAKIKNCSFTDAIKIILQNCNINLKSLIMMFYNDDQELVRVESGTINVKYELKLLKYEKTK